MKIFMSCWALLLLLLLLPGCSAITSLKPGMPSITAKMHNGSNSQLLASTSDTYYAPVRKGVPAWQVMIVMLVIIGILLFFVGLLIHRPTRGKNK